MKKIDLNVINMLIQTKKTICMWLSLRKLHNYS